MSHFDVQALMQFLDASPTPFHVVKNIENLLIDAGYQRIEPQDYDKLDHSKNFFISQDNSAILAYKAGKQTASRVGLRLLGAHTDSPCLKVKPNPDKYVKGYHMVRVQPYGGVLLSTWFDRDLSLAGDVLIETTQGNTQTHIIDFKRPVGSVPSLAIHLDRTANDGKTINAHNDMNVLLGETQTMPNSQNMALSDLIIKHLNEKGVEAKSVLDFNLSFYDVQPAAVTGINSEFISSARLDNLLSTYIGVRALIDSNDEIPCAYISNDHEEIGSQSKVGAKGPMLSDWFDAMYGDVATRQKVIAKSLMLSVDNAHGIHPNFPHKHDEQLGPVINQGPVIKYDVNQSYATGTQSAGVLKWLAAQTPSIPLQSFAVRSDMRCGSTIGPITATKLGFLTVDIGAPTFAMHSIRELGGVSDTEMTYALVKRFNESSSVTDT